MFDRLYIMNTKFMFYGFSNHASAQNVICFLGMGTRGGNQQNFLEPWTKWPNGFLSIILYAQLIDFGKIQIVSVKFILPVN